MNDWDPPMKESEVPGMLYSWNTNRVDDGACHKTVEHTSDGTGRQGETGGMRGERVSLSLSLSLSSEDRGGRRQDGSMELPLFGSVCGRAAGVGVKAIRHVVISLNGM